MACQVNRQETIDRPETAHEARGPDQGQQRTSMTAQPRQDGLELALVQRLYMMPPYHRPKYTPWEYSETQPQYDVRTTTPVRVVPTNCSRVILYAQFFGDDAFGGAPMMYTNCIVRKGFFRGEQLVLQTKQIREDARSPKCPLNFADLTILLHGFIAGAILLRGLLPFQALDDMGEAMRRCLLRDITLTGSAACLFDSAQDVTLYLTEYLYRKLKTALFASGEMAGVMRRYPRYFRGRTISPTEWSQDMAQKARQAQMVLDPLLLDTFQLSTFLWGQDKRHFYAACLHRRLRPKQARAYHRQVTSDLSKTGDESHHPWVTGNTAWQREENPSRWALYFWLDRLPCLHASWRRWGAAALLQNSTAFRDRQQAADVRYSQHVRQQTRLLNDRYDRRLGLSKEQNESQPRSDRLKGRKRVPPEAGDAAPRSKRRRRSPPPRWAEHGPAPVREQKDTTNQRSLPAECMHSADADIKLFRSEEAMQGATRHLGHRSEKDSPGHSQGAQAPMSLDAPPSWGKRRCKIEGITPLPEAKSDSARRPGRGSATTSQQQRKSEPTHAHDLKCPPTGTHKQARSSDNAPSAAQWHLSASTAGKIAWRRSAEALRNRSASKPANLTRVQGSIGSAEKDHTSDLDDRQSRTNDVDENRPFRRKSRTSRKTQPLPGSTSTTHSRPRTASTSQAHGTADRRMALLFCKGLPRRVVTDMRAFCSSTTERGFALFCPVSATMAIKSSIPFVVALVAALRPTSSTKHTPNKPAMKTPTRSDPGQSIQLCRGV